MSNHNQSKENEIFHPAPFEPKVQEIEEIGHVDDSVDDGDGYTTPVDPSHPFLTPQGEAESPEDKRIRQRAELAETYFCNYPMLTKDEQHERDSGTGQIKPMAKMTGVEFGMAYQEIQRRSRSIIKRPPILKHFADLLSAELGFKVTPDFVRNAFNHFGFKTYKQVRLEQEKERRRQEALAAKPVQMEIESSEPTLTEEVMPDPGTETDAERLFALEQKLERMSALFSAYAERLPGGNP